MTSCQCRVERGRSTVLYHAVAIRNISHAWMSYCNCHREDGCYYPYTQKKATTQAAYPEVEDLEEKVADDEEQSEESE